MTLRRPWQSRAEQDRRLDPVAREMREQAYTRALRTELHQAQETVARCSVLAREMEGMSLGTLVSARDIGSEIQRALHGKGPFFSRFNSRD